MEKYIYGDLMQFESYIKEKIENKHTASGYYAAVAALCTNCCRRGFEELDPDTVIEYTKKLHGKWRVVQLRQGLLRLRQYDPTLRLPPDEELMAIQRSKRDHKLERKTLPLKETVHKLRCLRNERLKMGLMMMLYGGLRVGEVAALQKSDIDMSGDAVVVTVRCGKGGKYAQVRCMDDPYFRRHLAAFLQDADDEQPFYRDNTTWGKVAKLDIECHDLRRMAAQLFRERKLEELKSKHDLLAPTRAIYEEADKATMEFLRHSKMATTRQYLYRRRMTK